MSCARKRKAPTKFVQGDYHTDWIPVSKQAPPGCDMIDVTFTLDKRKDFYHEPPAPDEGVDDPMLDRTEESILLASTHTEHPNTLKYDANGIAFAVKFINEEECQRF